jgi:hypothetical protein
LKDDDELEDIDARLSAIESMIGLLAAQLPAATKSRFAAALHEQKRRCLSSTPASAGALLSIEYGY